MVKMAGWFIWIASLMRDSCMQHLHCSLSTHLSCCIGLVTFTSDLSKILHIHDHDVEHLTAVLLLCALCNTTCYVLRGTYDVMYSIPPERSTSPTG